MILNENLFENELTESVHELVKIKVPGYTNTWTSFDTYDITIAPGVVKRYFILENDKWGDETWNLVVSEDLSEVYETYDDIETCLRDEGIIDNLSESMEGESNWDKIMHVLNAEDEDELEEDIEKTSKGKWVNRGKEGTHGEFTTKKAAREQQKAMFAQGYKGESLEENIGSDIAEYQKWVDYDMKKYGKISDDTNEKIKKAGLKIVKDDHGDYEVIANEPNHDVTEALYQTKTISGTPMSFEVKDKKLIVKENGKVIIETEITDPESLKDQISSMSTVKTISEDVDENGPKVKDNGIAQMLIDAINGEWDTIKLYNDIIVNAETYSYPDIANVVRDISDEETLHVGQLQAALETVSPNVSSIQDGQEEAAKQLDDTTESSELKDYEEQK